MRKLIGIAALFALNLTVAGCAPTFQSQACPKAVAGPSLGNKDIIAFAKQHIQLMPQGNELMVVLPVDDFFRMGTPQLKPSGYPALAQLAALLKQYGPAKIKIAGFTDNVASHRQNLFTSKQQAKALLNYLWTQGLSANQLYAVGYGDRGAVADNAGAEGSYANRRIEITVKASCV